MEYQEILNFFDNTPNQQSKFRKKNLIEVNDDARSTYNVNSQIKFKTSMLRSSLCDYSVGSILVGVTITVTVLASGGNNNNIQVAFKNFAPVTNCISEINSTQIDNAKYIDVVMPIYNLIKYSENYSETSGSLWQYYRDEPGLANAGTLDNFPGNSASFKYKQKVTGLTEDDCTKAV